MNCTGVMRRQALGASSYPSYTTLGEFWPSQHLSNPTGPVQRLPGLQVPLAEPHFFSFGEVVWHGSASQEHQSWP